MARTLESNLAGVRARIAAAAARAGRVSEAIALVAVTKSVGAEVAAELVRLGQIDLGESRADELVRKEVALRAHGLTPRWHFVGHLQGNKVGRVVARAASIHSIDSVRLLEAVDRAAGEAGVRREVWIQVKLADEPSKSGLSPGEVPAVIERAARLAHVDLAGLMTIAPLAPIGSRQSKRESKREDERESERAEAARAVFRELSGLARDLAPAAGMRDAGRLGRMRTSMGMSGDFEAAIEAGSDLVRIGSVLFEGIEGMQGLEGGPA